MRSSLYGDNRENTVKKSLAAVLCLSTTAAWAVEPVTAAKPKEGYSYFTLGLESVTYQEKFSDQGETFQSDATALSPVINTGSLTRVNDMFDFSIDALATFSPGSVDEEWSNSQGIYQRNKFEYIKASTNVLIHYKVTPQWRVVAGPSMTYQTYKRYQNQSENSIYYGTWEESSTDIFLDAGVAYDSGSLHADSPWHSYFRVVAGVPMWSQTTNTAIDGMTFNDFGFRTSIDGGISYRLMKGLHLGWFVMAGYEKRFEEGPHFWRYDDNGSKQMATLPEATTVSFSTGLQVLWNM
ncbi:hypothetical protein C9I94_13250 [Photobacterium swingsii]|uniref:Omptin family outer membrane protease n=1 Tax=Photobacterium swingsii TaxID=680026 RepID=A0A2T3P536_9GAMM|nr:hypothetical protein [Photobacterium swingsii]PSW23670.1 hypothetical protein C9I94_13250 [Photobacterium swingsii]